MQNPFMSGKKPRRGSMGAALIFAMITVIGFIMALNYQPQMVKPKTTPNVAADSLYQSSAHESTFSDALLNVTLVTIAILAIILIGARYYRRYQQQGSMQGSPRMKVLARHSVGTHQHILYMRVDNRKLLIGVTEHAVNLLSDLGEIDDQEESDRDIPPTDRKNFRRIVDRLKKENEDISEK